MSMLGAGRGARERGGRRLEVEVNLTVGFIKKPCCERRESESRCDLDT